MKVPESKSKPDKKSLGIICHLKTNTVRKQENPVSKPESNNTGSVA